MSYLTWVLFSLIILLLLLLLLLGGMLSLPAPSISQRSESQSDIFALLLSPGSLVFDSDVEETKTVLVSIEPFDEFSDPVNIQVRSIAFQDDNTDMSADGMSAVLGSLAGSPGTISSEEYTSGIPLFVHHDGKARKGNYLLTLQTESRSITKTFILPITIE